MTDFQASILVVEDHPDSREALTRMLRLNGYDVASATTAREARLLAAYRSFDLAICDLFLPDESGHTLFADLRRGHALPGIAVTGSSMSDSLRDIERSGFNAYLFKPLVIDTLLKTIEVVLTARAVSSFADALAEAARSPSVVQKNADA